VRLNFPKVFPNTRAIGKLTSGDLLTKQAMTEKNVTIYKKSIHTSAASQNSHRRN
jgi:hypothetical protein